MKTINRGAMLAGLVLMLGLFNLVVFLLPMERSSAFWAAYIFATLAFLLQALFFELSFGKAINLKSIFLGYPIAYLGSLYLVLQAIFSLIVITVETIQVQTTVIISAALLALTLSLLVLAFFSREEIVSVEEKVKAKRFYNDNLYSEVELLQKKAVAPEAQTSLKKLAETIRFSDPMSCPALTGIENAIEAKVSTLKELVTNADAEAIKAACAEITELIAERNAKCKLMK